MYLDTLILKSDQFDSPAAHWSSSGYLW